MLILTRTPLEEICIGNDIVITVLGVKGNQVRIGIDAPRSVNVDRGEVRRKPDYYGHFEGPPPKKHPVNGNR